MPTLKPAKPEVYDVARATLEKFHPELAEIGLTYKILMAIPPKGGGPTLTHNGYPAAATIKIVSAEQRLAGGPDVLIKIAADAYGDLDQIERAALLDHEWTHLEPDYMGGVDDAGRPRLKLRKHDWQLGGFHVITDRWGIRCIDAVALQDAARTATQMELPFGEPEDEAVAAAERMVEMIARARSIERLEAGDKGARVHTPGEVFARVFEAKPAAGPCAIDLDTLIPYGIGEKTLETLRAGGVQTLGQLKTRIEVGTLAQVPGLKTRQAANVAGALGKLEEDLGPVELETRTGPVYIGGTPTEPEPEREARKPRAKPRDRKGKAAAAATG